MPNYSIYIHIPFCVHRCAYCDFFSTAGNSHLIPAYVDALLREIEVVSRAAGQELKVGTIYFGGGTPSLLAPEQVSHVINSVRHSFLLEPDAEISLEANPGTVTPKFLEGYRLAGVNRISLGMQTALQEELHLLERVHSLEDVINAMKWSREAGFENINLDLIYGLPGQSMQSWSDSLKFALELQPEHLSLYCLTLEDDTRLAQRVRSGTVARPDDDLAADQYEWAIEVLSQEGYHHYEISNWAKIMDGNDLTCRHNLQYWRNQPYIGFGAGAHGYLYKKRTANVSSVQAFIDMVHQNKVDFPAGPAAETSVDISTKDEIEETMMMGLRLLQEGVNKQVFLERFGTPIELIYDKELVELTRLGLIKIDESICLTHRGMMVANQVVMRFLDEPEGQ